jgi:hypothetical protein
MTRTHRRTQQAPPDSGTISGDSSGFFPDSDISQNYSRIRQVDGMHVRLPSKPCLLTLTPQLTPSLYNLQGDRLALHLLALQVLVLL